MLLQLRPGASFPRHKRPAKLFVTYILKELPHHPLRCPSINYFKRFQPFGYVVLTPCGWPSWWPRAIRSSFQHLQYDSRSQSSRHIPPGLVTHGCPVSLRVSTLGKLLIFTNIIYYYIKSPQKVIFQNGHLSSGLRV